MSSLVLRRYCTCESHHEVKLFTALPAQHKFSRQWTIAALAAWRTVLPASPSLSPHQCPIPTIVGTRFQIGRSPTPKTAGLRLACLGKLSRVMRGGQVAGPCPMISSWSRTLITRSGLAAARKKRGQKRDEGCEGILRRRGSARIYSAKKQTTFAMVLVCHGRVLDPAGCRWPFQQKKKGINPAPSQPIPCPRSTRSGAHRRSPQPPWQKRDG